MTKLNLKLAGALGAAILAFFVATACDSPAGPSGTGGSVGTKNVPGKISADLPKSLTPASGASAKMASFASKAASKSLSPRTVGDASIAHTMITGVVDQMKSSLFAAALNLVFVDEVISQNGLSTSSSEVSGKSVTVTDNMIATIKSLIPDSMSDYFGDSLPAVGQSFPLDPFVYNTTSTSPYNFSFTQTYDYGDGMAEEMVLSWDSAKKKVGLSFATPAAQAGISYEFSISYDDATKTSTMISNVDTGSSFSYKSTIQIKEDATNTANHGAVIFFDDRYEMGTVIESYNAQGVADDLGGYIVTTYTTFDSTTPSDKDTFYYKESFDVDGIVTGESYSTNGTDWTDYGTLDSDYTSDYNGTDFDAIGDEISDQDYSSGNSSYYYTELLPDGVVADDEYAYFAVYSSPISSLPAAGATVDYTNLIGDGFAYGYTDESDPVDLSFYYDEQTVGTTVYAYKLVWDDIAADYVYAEDGSTGNALRTDITLTEQ